MDITDQERRRIGETVRVLRETRGFSQSEFANELAISRPYISLIESGKKPLNERLLARMVDVLGVRPIAIVREGYFDRAAAEAQADAHRRLREAERIADVIDDTRTRLDHLTAAHTAALAALRKGVA